MTTINDLRSRVRQDLHDEDSAGYRWSDAELNRHLLHAVKDFSQAAPLEQKATLEIGPNKRELDISSLADLVQVYAVEYPTDIYPLFFVEFKVWSGTIHLKMAQDPVTGEAINVYWGQVHSLDGTGSTVPSRFEELLVVGAAAYASLEWANYAIGRLNTGGAVTWSNYFQWGQAGLEVFRRGLKDIDRKRKVRSRVLTAEDVGGF